MGRAQRRLGVLPDPWLDKRLLVQNHEYADEGLLFPDGIANWSAEKTNKSINAHGVSIIEIVKEGGKGKKEKGGEWQVVRPSPYARRIRRRLRSGSAVRRRAMIGSRQAQILPAS